MSFYFKMQPFTIDELLGRVPQTMDYLAGSVGEMDNGAPFPDHYDFSTPCAAELAGRQCLYAALTFGIAKQSAGVNLQVCRGTETISTIIVHKGSLICPRCFAIEPTDGKVFIVSKEGFSTEMGEAIWMVDRSTGKLMRSWVKAVSEVFCKKCGTTSPVGAVSTGIDEVLNRELGIRCVSLRGEMINE